MFGKRTEFRGEADSEMISYPCINSLCTYRHTGSGTELKTAWRFTCPECKTETLLDPDDLEYLLQSARPPKAASAA